MSKTLAEWREQASLAQELGDVDAELEAREAIESLSSELISTEDQRIKRHGITPEQAAGIQSGELSAQDIGIEGASFADWLQSAGEAALAIGSGIVSEPVAGLMGSVTALGRAPEGESYKAGEDVEVFRNLLTYTPKTEAGKAVLEDFSGYVKTGADAVGLTAMVNWLEETGKEGAAAGEELGLPPAALAFIETAPQILPELLAATTQSGSVKRLLDAPQVQKILKADISAPVTKGVDYVTQKTAPIFTQQSAFKQGIAKKLQQGSRDPETAKWMIVDDSRTVDVTPDELQRVPSQVDAPEIKALPSPDDVTPEGVGFERIKQGIELETPRIAKDKVATEAVKQGFDEGVIASIKAASPADRRKMREMVSIKESVSKDLVKGQRIRPSDVVGRSVKERISFIANKKREAGKAIEKAAENLKGKTVKSADAFNNFADDLQDLDITFDIDTKKPVFDGSMLEGDVASQKILETIINRAKGAARNGGDAYELHKLKRFIDNKVNYGVSKEGLSGDAERIVKRLRRNIDEALDKADPDYDAANTIYSETKSVLDDIQGVAGKKIDIEGASADKSLGTLSRRLMSNAQSRVQLLDALDQLEVLSKKYGAGFDDDIMVQALFFDELDTVFKPSARTSLHGEFEKAAARGARAVAEPKGGVIDLAAGAVGKAAKKIQGINEENAYKAIKELLERE